MAAAAWCQRRLDQWAGHSAPSACARATVSISRFPTRPRRIDSVMTSMACQRMCPAAEVSLYTYHNPGEEMAQAVSLNGRPYTELPTAFQYRKSMSPECSCRRPGESWAQTLKTIGPDDTVAPGDVVVTEQNAKQLSQPRRRRQANSTRSAATRPAPPRRRPRHRVRNHRARPILQNAAFVRSARPSGQPGRSPRFKSRMLPTSLACP